MLIHRPRARTLELREGQQNIKGQAPHRGRRVETAGSTDTKDAPLQPGRRQTPVEFAADSLLEEAGFEPSVPRGGVDPLSQKSEAPILMLFCSQLLNPTDWRV